MSRPYVSRWNPAAHVLSSPKVRSTNTYARYYDITYDLIKAGDFPLVRTTLQQLTCRTLELKKEQLPTWRDPSTAKTLGPYSMNEARTVPPTSALSMGRYSGQRLDGKPGASGLYVGSVPAFAREHFHYANPEQQEKKERQKKQPTLLGPDGFEVGPGRLVNLAGPDRLKDFAKQELSRTSPSGPPYARFYAYWYNRKVPLADMSITTLYRLFRLHLRDAKTLARYEISEDTPPDLLAAEVFSQFDYSASRGMADAIHDSKHLTGVEGISATSARGESDTGVVAGLAGPALADNQLLYGPPGALVASLTSLKIKDQGGDAMFSSVNDLILMDKSKRLTD